MSDPLRSGAIFRVAPDDPVLRSPVPRLHASGGGSGSTLHRPSPQRPAMASTRSSFEELYRQSPMPKVIAGFSRPSPRAARPSPSGSSSQHRTTPLPSVPAFDDAGGSGGSARGSGRKAKGSPARRRRPDTVVLTDWSVDRAAVDGAGSAERLVVRGQVTGAAAAAPRVSSPIAVRISARKLMTESETVYALQGAAEDGALRGNLAAFKNGFPKDWKKHLEQPAEPAAAAAARPAASDDVVPDSDSEGERPASSPAKARGRSAARKPSPKAAKAPKAPKAPKATPPGEAAAKAKARQVAEAARAAQAAASSEQDDSEQDAMTFDAEDDSGRRSSRIARGEPTDYRRMSGKRPSSSPSPAKPPKASRGGSSKPRRRSSHSDAPAPAPVEEPKLDLEKMPVSQSGRRRMPPLPFWANSKVRRDRDYNVIDATAGRDVSVGVRDERAVLQPQAAAAAPPRKSPAPKPAKSSSKRRSSSDKRSERRSGGSKKKSRRRSREAEARAQEETEPDDDDEQGEAASAASGASGGQGQGRDEGLSSIKYMSVKELKAQLTEKGVDHSTCIEKQARPPPPRQAHYDSSATS